MTAKKDTVAAALPVGYSKKFSDALWEMGGLTPSLVIRTLVLHVVRTGALPEGLSVPKDLKRGRGAIGASVDAEPATSPVLTDIVGRAKALCGKVTFESMRSNAVAYVNRPAYSPKINDENLLIAFEAIFEGFANRPYFDVRRDKHIDHEGVVVDSLYAATEYIEALAQMGFHDITYNRAVKALKDYASADRREV